MLNEDENTKVKGTGSGFIWDKFGHIVSIPFFQLIYVSIIHYYMQVFFGFPLSFYSFYDFMHFASKETR